jgi:hypothetical protein
VDPTFPEPDDAYREHVEAICKLTGKTPRDLLAYARDKLHRLVTTGPADEATRILRDKVALSIVMLKRLYPYLEETRGDQVH